MEKTTLIEKIQMFFDVLSGQYYYLLLIPFFILLFFIKNKKIKKFLILLYVFILTCIFVVHREVIFAVYDTFVNNLFQIVLFPKINVLFFVAFISLVMIIISILNKTNGKLMKIIDASVFSIIQILFILAIVKLSSDDIDIYDNTSIYLDKDLLAIMQLFMGIFCLWVIFMITVNLIDYISEKIDKQEINNIKTINTKKISNKQTVDKKEQEEILVLEPAQLIIDEISNNIVEKYKEKTRKETSKESITKDKEKTKNIHNKEETKKNKKINNLGPEEHLDIFNKKPIYNKQNQQKEKVIVLKPKPLDMELINSKSKKQESQLIPTKENPIIETLDLENITNPEKFIAESTSIEDLLRYKKYVTELKTNSNK